MVAERARLEHGVRFDNSFVAGFARRLVMERPEMAGLLRLKRTSIPWDAIVNDLPNVDLGKPKRRRGMDREQAERVVEAIERAIEAKKLMRERRKIAAAYGFGEEFLEGDRVYHQAAKEYDEAIDEVARVIGGAK